MTIETLARKIRVLVSTHLDHASAFSCFLYVERDLHCPEATIFLQSSIPFIGSTGDTDRENIDEEGAFIFAYESPNLEPKKTCFESKVATRLFQGQFQTDQLQAIQRNRDNKHPKWAVLTLKLKDHCVFWCPPSLRTPKTMKPKPGSESCYQKVLEFARATSIHILMDFSLFDPQKSERFQEIISRPENFGGLRSIDHRFPKMVIRDHSVFAYDRNTKADNAYLFTNGPSQKPAIESTPSFESSYPPAINTYGCEPSPTVKDSSQPISERDLAYSPIANAPPSTPDHEPSHLPAVDANQPAPLTTVTDFSPSKSNYVSLVIQLMQLPEFQEAIKIVLGTIVNEAVRTPEPSPSPSSPAPLHSYYSSESAKFLKPDPSYAADLRALFGVRITAEAKKHLHRIYNDVRIDAHHERRDDDAAFFEQHQLYENQIFGLKEEHIKDFELSLKDIVSDFLKTLDAAVDEKADEAVDQIQLAQETERELDEERRAILLKGEELATKRAQTEKRKRRLERQRRHLKKQERQLKQQDKDLRREEKRFKREAKQTKKQLERVLALLRHDDLVKEDAASTTADEERITSTIDKKLHQTKRN